MRVTAALAVVTLGLAPDAGAAIYTCVDAKGSTVLRDSPCGRGERLDSTTVTRQPRPRANPETKAPLERKQVEQLVKRLDRAMGKGDQKAVLAVFARDARVELQLTGGKPPSAMDAESYSRYLAAAFSQQGYAYRAHAARISLANDKPRATLSRLVREGVFVGGVVKQVELHESLTVERDGGRLVISKVRKSAPGAGEEA
jgi:hypothetical protein